MDRPPTFGQDTVAPTAPLGMSATAGFPGNGADATFDQTIRVKTPASGTMFFNRYRLDRVLGRGGMGVVWLADDLKLERSVALKFLPSLLGLDSAAIKELKTETRRGLELSHPNIVRIYDFVDDEEMAAISMEYINGRTLSELRLSTPHGVFSAHDVVQWLPGVCAALDYAHLHRKVVHRDLKPANIMVTAKENLPKIADFGIARSLSDTMSRLTQMSTSGTLPYMSPQQAMGDRPTPTDDVYSLGATIYELLSGKPPFYRGDISTQLTSKIPSSMIERREELEIRAVDSIPKEWEVAIAKCLHKDASMRPQSAGALAEMLGLQNSMTGGVTKTFVQMGAPTASAHVQSRSKMPLYAAIAAGVVAVAGAAVYFTSSSSSEKPATAAIATPAVAPVETVAPAVPAVASPAPGPTPAAPAPVATDPVVATPAASATPPPAVVAAATPPPLPGQMVTTLPTETAPAALAAPPAAQPALVQPPVMEPPNGHWPLTMIFPTPPQAAYSENGRRHLLYEVQALLREDQLYSATQDGKEGKGTHNAIVLFQAKNGLVPNGLLDGPTLAAMELGDMPDDPAWKAPAVASSSSSRRRTPAKKDEPNLLQRAGKSIGKLFKRD